MYAVRTPRSARWTVCSPTVTQNTLRDAPRLKCKFWAIDVSAGLYVCLVSCKARSVDEGFYKVEEYREVDRKTVNATPGAGDAGLKQGTRFGEASRRARKGWR